MALSSSVWNPLRLSPAGGKSREAFDRQRSPHQRGVVSCLHYVGNIHNGRVSSSRLVVGGKRGRWMQKLGQEERMVVRAADNNGSNERGDTGTASSSSEGDVEALEARLGVGRRARKQQQQAEGGGGGGAQSKQGAPAKPKQAAKAWDSMSFTEKAWSLYIDPDKGVLFWLNKLAYGAIFAVIGGWILFRFIGPALGWYQLDQPLMSPERLLDES